MLQDPDRPPWMEDSLRHASARLVTKIGDVDYAALTEAVQTVDQWQTFQELMACSDFFVEQVARQHAWLRSALTGGGLLDSRPRRPEDWVHFSQLRPHDQKLLW